MEDDMLEIDEEISTDAPISMPGIDMVFRLNPSISSAARSGNVSPNCAERSRVTS